MAFASSVASDVGLDLVHANDCAVLTNRVDATCVRLVLADAASRESLGLLRELPRAGIAAPVAMLVHETSVCGGEATSNRE